MKKKKIIISGIALILVAGLSTFYVLNKGLKTEVVEARTHDVTDTFTENGIVKQGEASTITSKVEGNILKVLVKPNQYIEKGTCIATIDSKDYQYTLATHENNIKGYEAQIQETRHSEAHDKADLSYSITELQDKIKGLQADKKASDIKKVTDHAPEEYVSTLSFNVEIAESNYETAKRNVDQIKALYQVGASSDQEVKNAETALLTSKASLNEAKSQYEATQTQLTKLKNMGISSTELNAKFYAYEDENLDANINSLNAQIAALQHKLNNDYSSDVINRLEALIASEKTGIAQLQEQVKDCSITAPVSGYITDLPIQNLTQITPGTVLATLQPDNELTISCDVLTTCEPYLHVGDAVTLKQKLKSEDITYTGKIKEIYSFAKETTSALGLKEYRVEVRITPDMANAPFKDGYELETTFTTYTKSQALTVPNSAVFEMDDQDYVYIVKDQKAVMTPVTIEHKTNTQSVITEGIKDGDLVIYNANTEGITDGTILKPILKTLQD